MNSRKLVGYIMGIISLLAVGVAVFALLALIVNPANALIAALVILVSLPVAYLARKLGIQLRR